MPLTAIKSNALPIALWSIMIQPTTKPNWHSQLLLSATPSAHACPLCLPDFDQHLQKFNNLQGNSAAVQHHAPTDCHYYCHYRHYQPLHCQTQLSNHWNQFQSSTASHCWSSLCHHTPIHPTYPTWTLYDIYSTITACPQQPPYPITHCCTITSTLAHQHSS